MLSHLMLSPSAPRAIYFFYSVRRSPQSNTGAILFLDRLERLFALSHPAKDQVRELNIYVTGSKPIDKTNAPIIQNKYVNDSTFRTYERRFEHRELVKSLGPEYMRGNTVAYVCGPPMMTDEVVDVLQKAKDMKEENVLCEKWW